MIKNNSLWLTTKLVWLLYIFHCVWFYLKFRLYNNYLTIDYFLFILGFIYIFLYSEGLGHIFKNKIIRGIIGVFLPSFYFILGKYHYRVKTSFDYKILIDNLAETFHAESSSVILNTIKMKDFYHIGIVIISLILVEVFFKVFSKIKYKQNKKKGLTYLAVLLLSLFYLPYPPGEISYILKSAVDLHLGNVSGGKYYKELSQKKTPFLTEIKSKRTKRRPHIFIINIESFNALYVEKEANGKEITPVFNSLINEGLYIDDFYGNTVQTIKGQFSTLCSRLPLLSSKASYELDGKKLNCAPRILKKLGYETYFHKCFSNLNFDNTKKFMSDIGFDHIHTTSTNHMSKEQRDKFIWGWGVQDDVSYKQYVNRVIELHEKSNKPIFSMIHTVSHHMKFRAVPKRLRQIYPQQHIREHAFINSLHASDKFLEVFIKTLKEKNLYDNSLIIITGDHSYPNGEHGLFDNQTGYQQEFFKTPMLVIWKKHLQAKRIKNKTYSHIDLLPSILDLIGEHGEYQLIGQSFLDNTQESKAHLVQPYNGLILSIVSHPYKYVWIRKNNTELLFNLLKDPLEEQPIKNEFKRKELRRERDLIIFNSEDLLKNYGLE